MALFANADCCYALKPIFPLDDRLVMFPILKLCVTYLQ
jgi:hypothetical protein